MKPPRSRKYLEFIRTQPCAVTYCGFSLHIEAHHVGSRGISQKASDYQAIPLCRDHHTMGARSIHRIGATQFSELHKLDIPAVIRKLHEAAGPLVPEQHRAVAA